jgi:hypothetical protein
MASVMVLRLSRFAIVAIFVGFAVQMPVTEAEQVKEERFPARGVGASEESLYSTFQSYWEWKLATQPELATRVGRTEFNDKWRDLSKAARDHQRKERERDHPQHGPQRRVLDESGQGVGDVLRLGDGDAAHDLAALLEKDLRDDQVLPDGQGDGGAG